MTREQSFKRKQELYNSLGQRFTNSEVKAVCKAVSIHYWRYFLQWLQIHRYIAKLNNDVYNWEKRGAL